MRSKLAVLISVLLLTACESQPSAPVSDSSCGHQLSGAPSEPRSGVRLTGVSQVADCAEVEITNSGNAAAVYTITLTSVGSSKEAQSGSQTMPAVGAGQTMKYSVVLGRLRPAAGNTVQVKISQVRSVPLAEAPSFGGTCPPSGTRLYADPDPDAAMGLRDLGIHLENCGKHPVHLTGYPHLQLLDEDHKPVPEVKLLQAGGPPHPFDLKPGERASAHLVWRNTTESDAALNLPYARLRANPSAAPVMITPEFDLGTTGKLTITAWTKDQP